MNDSLAGFVLAAGAGTRLRPLTRLIPKPLCPVGGSPLLDQALAKVQVVASQVAVNVHHGRAHIEQHLARREEQAGDGTAGVSVHISVEPDQALGTAGALGNARDWLDGRPVVVLNGDTWSRADLTDVVAGWDGERIRVCVVGEGELGPRSQIVASCMPWSAIECLPAIPAGLYETSWAPAQVEGRLETVGYHGLFVDCATAADYLQANLLASGGESVVDETAVVEGDIDECVVWAGAHVRPGERLRRAIRADDRMTVLVR